MSFFWRNTRRRILAATLLLSLAAPAWHSNAAAPPGRRPKLVVILVVDQMRADYVDRYGHHWKNGLRRLFDRGAWFRRAAYPYMNTVTCPGHATIATGAIPATHGIILNDWYERQSARSVNCTDDTNAKPIAYGGESAERGRSAWRLQVPTLADVLRIEQAAPARVVTMSMKPRSAIMLAGRAGDAVTWFDETSGVWVTSDAFAKAPVPFVLEFTRRHPVSAELDSVWTRLLPEKAYLFEDDADGEQPPKTWTRTFPHPLRGANATDATAIARWRGSPFSDAYLGRMAAAAVDAMELGRRNTTDFLAVSFSALDTVGHPFGPRSHEVQDLLARLDATIGALLEHLDKKVGAENYVLALSADHGVAPIPEQMAARGLHAGRMLTGQVTAAIEKALTEKWGEGKYVARMTYPEIYFAPGIYARLQADDAAMAAVLKAIAEFPGAARALRGEEVSRAKSGHDPVLRAAGNSNFPGRSGDLVVIPKTNWFFVGATRDLPMGDATTHGTLYEYDARVPVILLGAGIRSGEYLTDASPADIAPTLAFLAGVTLPRTDGRVLSEALLPSPAPRAAPPKKSAPR